MKPNQGRAKELADLLCKELGIPDGVRWFEVRFAVDECVSVKCEYCPKSQPVEKPAYSPPAPPPETDGLMKKGP